MTHFLFLIIKYLFLIGALAPSVLLAQEFNTKDIAKSQLKLQLIGTIVQSKSEKSIASISGGVYSPIENIKNKAKLLHISRFEAYILNLKTQKKEYISVGPYQSKQSTNGKDIFNEEKSEYHLKGSFINKVTGNLSSFLKDAGTQLVKNSSGKTIGFKLTFIKKGSVFDGLGLEVGDVLSDVNNNQLDSITSVIGIFNQLKGSSMISLGVIRGDKKKSLTYLIRK